MKRFGFNNFKRFESLAPIELGDVNILVGGNNAGKSTYVKAIMMACDFLKNWKYNENVIDLSRLQSCSMAHLRTFEDIVTYNKENADVSFSMQFNNFSLKIDIEPRKDQKGVVKKVEFSDLNIGKHPCSLIYDFQKMEIALDVDSTIIPNEEFRSFVANDKTNAISEEITRLCGEINKKVENKTDALDCELNAIFEGIGSLSEEISKFFNTPNVPKFIKNPEDSFKQIFYQKIVERKKRIVVTKKFEIKNDNNANIRNYTLTQILRNAFDNSYQMGIYPYSDKINKITRQIENVITNAFEQLDYSYCSIINITLDRVYLQKDSGDVPKALKEYFVEEDLSTEKQMLHNWVNGWLEKFNIGTDFVIEPIKFEAIYSDIIQGETAVRLNSLGMGSIHMYILLLKIATFISKMRRVNKNTKTQREKLILLIEEPELNLHPDLHVLLTDLFLDASQQFGIQIIVETHSEYLIRQTQVIVSKLNDGEKNPFKVYYFPKDEKPYEMEYRKDGKFSNKFGKGFFDVASTLAFELF